MDIPKHSLTLALLPDRLMVCRLPAEAEIPDWVKFGGISALIRTNDEFSILCEDGAAPEGIPAERGWRALKVSGPLQFSMVGVLASLVMPLAQAGVSIFVISTYDTDYLLVKEFALPDALLVLRQAGHSIVGQDLNEVKSR